MEKLQKIFRTALWKKLRISHSIDRNAYKKIISNPSTFGGGFSGDFDGLQKEDGCDLDFQCNTRTIYPSVHSIPLLTSLKQRKGIRWFRFSFEISRGASPWDVGRSIDCICVCCLIVLYVLSMRPESRALLYSRRYVITHTK